MILPLPRRAGLPPTVSVSGPQRQLDQHTQPELWGRLLFERRDFVRG